MEQSSISDTVGDMFLKPNPNFVPRDPNLPPYWKCKMGDWHDPLGYALWISNADANKHNVEYMAERGLPFDLEEYNEGKHEERD
jgi:hypothetical protein